MQNAADRQRYWTVAKQLVEAGQFSTSSETYTPLRKSGPLTGTFFSAAIYVFGADWGSRIIIFLQCVLLFAMGVLSRELAIPFSANKNVVQSLIIFNPNLLGLAHSAQSDLLFAFLATIFLVVSSRVIRDFNRPRIIPYLWLGIIVGFMALSRFAGFYLIFFFPIFFLVSLYFSRIDNRGKSYFRNIIGLVCASGIALLITTPWTARNYTTFGTPHFVYGASNQCYQNLLVLQQLNRDNLEVTPDVEVERQIFARMEEEGAGSCFDVPRSSCEELQASACMPTILHQPITLWITGYSKAFIATFASGGVSQLANYMSFEKGPTDRTLFYTFVWGEVWNEVRNQIKFSPSWIILYVLCYGFVFVTRVAALVTISRPRIFWDSENRAYTIFFVLFGSWYFFLHLFIGVSRFRAPLEPLLMLLAALGLCRLTSLFTGRSYRRTALNHPDEPDSSPL